MITTEYQVSDLSFPLVMFVRIPFVIPTINGHVSISGETQVSSWLPSLTVRITSITQPAVLQPDIACSLNVTEHQPRDSYKSTIPLTRVIGVGEIRGMM